MADDAVSDVVAKIKALQAAEAANYSSDDSGDEVRPGEAELDKEMRKEAKCRARLARAKEKYGNKHVRVVYWSLRLVDQLIPQYKLNDTEDTLNDIMDYARELGGNHHIKAVQARAFNLFKQYKFKESLACFKEQEKLCGPSPMLYENLAHVNNSIGDYDQAAHYFTLANAMLENGPNAHKRGGVMLGLGLVKERLGRPDEALPILIQALELYKKDVGSEDGGSIIAKAHMSVGQCYENLQRLPEAITHIEKAVKIFQKTTGDSPLTANAHGVLGRLLYAQGKVDEAEPEVLKSLELEVDKDAFHMETVWKLMHMLKEISTGDKKKRTLIEMQRLCRKYIGVVQRTRARLNTLGADPTFDKGTAGVLLKTGGELVMLSGCYQQAIPLLEESIKQLQTVKNFDCSGLIDSCRLSISFCADKADVVLPPEPVAAA